MKKMNNKIMSLYAYGMSCRDIAKHITGMCGLDISDVAVAKLFVFDQDMIYLGENMAR
nr:transposase [Acinetobacter kyonggiensis]